MSTTLLRHALPRRLTSVLVTALFGLTLAVNPVSAPAANAAVSYRVGVRAMQVAAAQRGIPYVWGGTTRRGFDCSGLTQYAYARAGRRIPRVAQAQYNATIHIRSGARRLGDLVFFYSGRYNGRNIHHVGIYAGGWNMWAAPHTGARVRKQRIYSTHIFFGRVR